MTSSSLYFFLPRGFQNGKRTRSFDVCRRVD